MNLDTILSGLAANSSPEFIVNTVIDSVEGVLSQVGVEVDFSAEDLQIQSSDQGIVTTFFDPFKSDIEPTVEDPTFDTINSNTVYQTVASVPMDVYHEPVGNEPPLSYKGQYPYVSTFKSESGHVKEIDDTPGNERLFEYHRTGSYREINNEGRIVEKSVSDHYTVVMKDKHLYVEGTAEIYVKGNIKIICLNDATIDVAGRVEVNAGEDIRMKGRSIYLESSSGDISINSAGNINTKSALDTNIYSTAGYNNHAAGAVKTQAASISTKSSGEHSIDSNSINIKSNDTFNIDASSDLNFRSGATIGLDGTSIKMQEKVTMSVDSISNIDVSAKSKKTGLGSPLSRAVASVPSVAEELVQGLDDDPDQVSAIINEAVRNNRISQEEADLILNPKLVDPQESIPGNGVNLKGVLDKANLISKLPDSAISGELKISDYFKLCQLTDNRPKAGAHSIIAQNGLSKAQIASNLSALADNTLDPIKVKYGTSMTINSAFRRGSGRSQHVLGQAADITYGSKSKSVDDMIEIAKWIRDNVVFDQLILEYGNSEIWTHVSFDRNKSVQRGQVLTCRHPFAASIKYEPGIIKYPWSA